MKIATVFAGSRIFDRFEADSSSTSSASLRCGRFDACTFRVRDTDS